MADLTTQVLLDFNITGNNAVAAGIDKLVASQKELAEKTLRNETVNKSFALSLVKTKLKLSDLGKSLEDAGIASDDWDAALGGNQAKIIAVRHELGKLEKATKADIAVKKKAKIAAKKGRDELDLLELKLKEHGITLKQAAGHTRKLTAARKGDIGALKIVREAVRQTTKANKNHSKSILEMLFGVRSLRNEQGKLTVSFSVLRSKLLLGAFAFGMVSRTIGKFVKSAGDAEEVTNKFNTVFGQSSDEALKFARSIGQRAETELKSFLSTIQDTLVPLGFMRDSAAGLSQTTVQLALDVASFNNKMDADVIRDFQSAMVGNHETVKKYGIILNQGRVELEAFRLGLADVDGNINEQSKAFARLSLIVAGSKDAHGDLSRTQGELNNQLKALGATSKESMEMIGNAIKPAVILLIKFANVALSPTAITLYTTALAVLAVRMVNFTRLTHLARKSAIAFNLALGRTPMGLLIVGLSALAGTLAYFALKEDEAAESTDNMTDSMEAQRLELVKRNALSLEEQIELEEEAWSDLDRKIIENIALVKEQGETQKKLVLSGTQYKEIDIPNVLIAENEGYIKKANAIGAVIEGLEIEIEQREFLKQQAFENSVKELTKSYEDQLLILSQTTELNKVLTKEALKLGLTNKDELSPAVVKVITDFIEEKQRLEDVAEASKKAEKAIKALTKAQEDAANKFDEFILKKFKELDFDTFLSGTEGWRVALETIVPDDLEHKFETAIGFFQGLSVAAMSGASHTKEFSEALSQQMVESLEGMTETTSAMMGLSDSVFAHDKLLLDQKTESEIQAVLSSRKSEKRKAAEIKNIKEQAAIDERKLRAKQKPFMIAETISNTAVGISNAMKLIYPLNFAVAALIALTGAKQIQTINAQKFAKGGDFITDRPEIIQVGEAGRERVTITPVDRPESRALGSMGGNVNINFSGNVLSQDFIEDEAIPMIKEAIRRGADIGVA